jgi:parallel beta-helix repeat protein
MNIFVYFCIQKSQDETMKKKIVGLIILILLSIFESFTQSVSFPDDERERGYYDRPYKRYEAESGKCITSGILLAPTYDQREIQSEASNQMAVQLGAENDFVQWTNDEAADGLTVRYSIPDSAEGNGTKGTLDLYVDGIFVQTIILNSYWAWQYFLKNMSNPYPDNTPGNNKFPRMRFDEIHLKLDVKIPKGANFKLLKTDGNNIPYTIDFVELELVPPITTFESIPDENKVEYSPDKGDLSSFIAFNSGKTIYIPAGKYETDARIMLNADRTGLIGAGMWYTEIYFTASSDDRSTYNRRGIETANSNILLEGLFLNTVNDKRYYQNNDSYQVGKGLMGSFGSNSVIKNVWVEHFECGAWIEGTDNLTVSNCRFRNNYADGINLAYGCKNSVVEHCSFRNNGDDDMATWSRSGRSCDNNTFRYAIVENNWRASGLGFFGGKQNIAHHCVIIDPMEAGFRITCDFPGAAFGSDGYSEFYDISVYRGGVKSGTSGVNGDLWGNQQGALHINSSSQYDLQNIRIYNIDLYDSKNDAVFIGSSNKSIQNLVLKDIRINGTQRYGIFFSNAKGSGYYCRIEYRNIGADTNTNNLPSSFNLTENCGTYLPVTVMEEFKAVSFNGNIKISGCRNSPVSVFDLSGRKVSQTASISNQIIIPDLQSGIYIVRLDNHNKTLKTNLNR